MSRKDIPPKPSVPPLEDEHMDAASRQFSRRLSEADFSHRSKGRENLRRQLLAAHTTQNYRRLKMARPSSIPRTLAYSALVVFVLFGLGWLLSNTIPAPEPAAVITPLPSEDQAALPETTPEAAATDESEEPAPPFTSLAGPLTFSPVDGAQANFFYADVFSGDQNLGRIEFGSIDGGWCDRSANGGVIAILHEKMTSAGSAGFANEPATLRWFSLGSLGEINDPFPDMQVMSPPTFSPNGFRLAFSACTADGNCGLFMYDLETGELERISPHSPIKPVLWSPDGAALAFEVSAGEQVQLHVISADTGSTTFLGERVPPGTTQSYWGRTLPQGVEGVERCAAAPGPDLPDPLTMDADSEAIRLRILFSHTLWDSMWVNAELNDYNGAVSYAQHTQVWLQQPAKARVLNGPMDGVPAVFWVSDGEKTRSGEDVRIEPYNPPTGESNSVYPHPMTYIMPTPLSSLLFPAGLAQRGGSYVPVAIETIAGREALVVDWDAPFGTVIDRFWVDTQTGVILRQQNRGKDGSGQLTSDYIVTAIEYNLGFAQETFSLSADFPSQFAAGSQDIFIDDEPPEPVGTPETSLEFGEVYLSLTAPGGFESSGLVHFPAACLVTNGACPQPDFVDGLPKGFAYMPLSSWSADQTKLVYTLSGPPDQVWVFDRTNSRWTLIDAPYFYGAVWSPDGEWLAGQPPIFGSADRNPIILARTDGSDHQQLLVEQPGLKTPIGWVNDHSILFVNVLDNEMSDDDPYVYSEIQLYDMESGEVEVLTGIRTNANFSMFSSPQLSPDRSRFVYTVNDWRAGTTEVYLYDLAARTESSFVMTIPASLSWTPDGQKWAASAALGYTCSISLLNTDGSGLVSLYEGDGGGSCTFSWSPDGRFLLIPQTVHDPSVPRLVVVDVETGEERMLELPAIGGVSFEWVHTSWLP